LKMAMRRTHLPQSFGLLNPRVRDWQQEVVVV